MTPFHPISPGEFLLDELKERGWTVEIFALIIGHTKRYVELILSGKKI